MSDRKAGGQEWPPAEPIYPATVVGRLDILGWTPDCTTLVEHSRDYALVSYRSVYPDRFVLLDLRDGHEVAAYADDGAPCDLLRRLRERDRTDRQAQP